MNSRAESRDTGSYPRNTDPKRNLKEKFFIKTSLKYQKVTSSLVYLTSGYFSIFTLKIEMFYFLITLSNILF